MSLHTRFGRSDSPTPCTGTRTESIAMAHTCTAEAMRRVAAARAHYRRSAQRDMRPQHPTVAPVRHPHTHARTHTLHGMQACRTRRPGMRAAAAAAAVMGAMVPPFEDMPGDEPGTSRGKRPPDTPEGGLCTMPDGIRPHQKGQAMAIVFATPEPIKSMPVQSSIAGMPRRSLSSVITGSARRALVSNRIGLEAIFRICAELGKKCAVSSRIQPRRDEAIDANRCRSETCSAPRACLCRQCEWRETHDAMLSWGNQIYAQCHCPKAGRERRAITSYLRPSEQLERCRRLNGHDRHSMQGFPLDHVYFIDQKTCCSKENLAYYDGRTLLV